MYTLHLISFSFSIAVKPHFVSILELHAWCSSWTHANMPRTHHFSHLNVKIQYIKYLPVHLRYFSFLYMSDHSAQVGGPVYATCGCCRSWFAWLLWGKSFLSSFSVYLLFTYWCKLSSASCSIQSTSGQYPIVEIFLSIIQCHILSKRKIL